ncbi:MAG: TIGR02206 family membrane protein [Firmicutes bacterium]|nr:TIGR02206 family membrane protein [Bacillota bacterium]
MSFFAPRGEFPAAGLFSAGHLFMLAGCIVLLITLCKVFLKEKSNEPYTMVKVVAVTVLILEIIKTVWGISAGRYSDWYEYLPIWFCSLFIPFSLLAGFTKGGLRKLALSFMYYGGLIGGVAYLFFPTTSIGRYPFWHFITMHSMFYHTIMIFMALYIVKNRLIKPSVKDLKSYVLTIIAACIVAFFVNQYFGTNYMFLTKPANNNAPLQLIAAVTGAFYPVVITLCQAFISFFGALGLYRLTRKE